MYETEKELSDAIKEKFIKEYGKAPEKDDIGPAIIRAYLKLLILNCIQMYIDTQDMDYAYTLKILLKLFYVSEFDGKVRRRHGVEAELIMDEIMPELYDIKPPAEIADMVIKVLPEIRRERREETRRQERVRRRMEYQLKKQRGNPAK